MGSFPYLVPPTLTIDAAAAPPLTLQLTLVTVLLGALVLIPSLAYLFRIFKGQPSAFERLSDGAGGPDG